MVKAEQDLASSLVGALRRISRSTNGDITKLVFKCLEALKLLPIDGLERCVNARDLAGIDVFTPILRCKELENRLDVVAIYLAYFSVHRELQSLVSGTIKSWQSLVHDEVKLLVQDKYEPGILTVLSWLNAMHGISPEVLQRTKFGLGPVLVTSWIPLWLSRIEHGAMNLSELPLLGESVLDFYIAIDGAEFVENHVIEHEKSPLSYHVYKVCKRMIKSHYLVPQKSFAAAVQFVSPVLGKVDDLSFALQIIMEVVDHPELNLLETPHFCLLLSLSLKKIHETHCHILHATLGSLGSVQSLPALINMAQFLLARILVNSNNVLGLLKTSSQTDLNPEEGKWYFPNLKDYRVPQWFEASMIPPMPPIPKSNFVFSPNEAESEGESGNSLMTAEVLCESLNTITLINTKILKEYDLLGLDPLCIDSKFSVTDSSVSHKIMQCYLELYYVPIVTTLLLSNQLAVTRNSLLGEMQAKIWSRILHANVTKLYEMAIQTHGNTGLYYLVRFIAKISLDDMVLQELCVELLNQLYFHDKNHLAKELTAENVLTKQALLDYISMWNDGTEVYGHFFTEIFEQQQPSIGSVSITIDEMIQMLPDREAIQTQQQEIEKRRKKKKGPSGKHSLQTQANVRDSFRNTPKKYDAYAAAPFIPASKPAHNMTPSFMAQTPDYGQPAGLEAWDSSDISCSTTKISTTGNEMRFTSSLMSGPPEKTDFDLPHYDPRTRGAAPKTPNMTSSTLFSSPWDASADLQSTPDSGKIVSTGKNYILGGHNRVKNNSRAQSIHIDSFGYKDQL